MRPVFPVILGYLARFRARLALLFSAAGPEPRPTSYPDSPRIFDGEPEAPIPVRTARGAAPLRPAFVQEADFSHPRTRALARRAAIFLFDEYDFLAAPGQFWPFLERFQDPGQAFAAFLRAVGCDPQLIRRKDAGELRKAADIIEFLALSGDIIHRLPAQMQHILGLELESGNYAQLRRVAETASQLQTALDQAALWRAKHVMPSFAELLRTIETMLENAMAYTPEDAAGAVSLVLDFSSQQQRLDDAGNRFAFVCAELKDSWPEAWRGAPQDEELRSYISKFEHVADGLDSEPGLSLDQIQEGVSFLLGYIDALENLLAAIRSKSKSGHKDDGPDRSGKDARLDDIEIALRYFNFSSKSPPRTRQELQQAFRRRAKEIHPDRATTEAMRQEYERECKECNRHNTILKKHFSWN